MGALPSAAGVTRACLSSSEAMMGRCRECSAGCDVEVSHEASEGKEERRWGAGADSRGEGGPRG